MKTKNNALALAVLLAIGFVCRQAQADIIINNYSLTQNSLSFDLPGTLPEPISLFPDAFYFCNPDITATPGFALNGNIAADSYLFTGTQPLRAPDGVAGGFLYMEIFSM